MYLRLFREDRPPYYCSRRGKGPSLSGCVTRGSTRQASSRPLALRATPSSGKSAHCPVHKVTGVAIVLSSVVSYMFLVLRNRFPLQNSHSNSPLHCRTP